VSGEKTNVENSKIRKKSVMFLKRHWASEMKPPYLPPPLTTAYSFLSMSVPVCSLPRLCRQIWKSGTEHGTAGQRCVGWDPRAAAILHAYQGHPASAPTPCQPQSNHRSRTAIRRPHIQCLSICLPAHPLLKARGTWSPGPHREDQLGGSVLAGKLASPQPQKGLALSPGTITTSLPLCQ
jgi:hypothetical protein